jgi:hypothetical protein
MGGRNRILSHVFIRPHYNFKCHEPDLLALDNEYEEGLPSDRRRIVRQSCDGPSAYQWQREAILHFSAHKFTLVAEPPGPSKSMLVELLMILLGNIEGNAWYCIGSNASMDVCGSFCPHAVIIGGSSRATEVSCILLIVQGLRTGQLKRVLVSGDSQQQLPRWWTCCTVFKPHQNMVISVISLVLLFTNAL